MKVTVKTTNKEAKPDQTASVNGPSALHEITRSPDVFGINFSREVPLLTTSSPLVIRVLNNDFSTSRSLFASRPVSFQEKTTSPCPIDSDRCSARGAKART